ncbi:hypothetical protein [Nitratireductor soli]|uniref:hypothetical protein n=1 Tax=Nitratireductor soli TaxID=1670619 RepID=UPI00065E4CA1|nr:hypothetical protein [Nitratireductor soli]
MPLQNRVDPFGQVQAVSARGMFTGNRGVIHDPDTRTLLNRCWTTKAWLVCACEFRGRRRAVMGRNAPSGAAGWTELFFLDEVTALAAGHRPCFFCRRSAARDFMDRFREAAALASPKVADLDGRLHGERLASTGRVEAIGRRAIAHLPDGAMIADGRAAFALRHGQALPWRFEGYGAARPVADLPDSLALLTPRTTLAVLRAGYRPAWHATAV